MMNQLSKRDILKKKLFAYMMLFVSSILFVIGLQGFLQIAQTFASGLSAFAALPTFIWPVLNQYISLIYFVLNIPLIIIYWNKVSKRFMSRTIFTIATQAAMGALFIIPQLHSAFKNLLDFDQDINEAQWPILILAFMGSILMGFGISISWKYGGSTGGTDIITYYYSTKRRVSVGSIMFGIAISITVVSFAVSISTNEEMRSRWLITLFSSVTYVAVVSLIVATVYPKYQTVRMQITSDKAEIISKSLKEKDYWHSWTISKCISGFSGNDKSILRTNMYLLETKQMVRFIKSLDDEAYITITPIRKVFGNMNTQGIEDHY